MDFQSVCNFVPSTNSKRDLLTLNFVYETTLFPEVDVPIHVQCYCCCLVSEGSAVLHLDNNIYPLKSGDIFFISPGIKYAFETVDNFRFYYISYIGARANALAERLQFKTRLPVFPENERLIPFWQQALGEFSDGNSDLVSEGVLLYTLSTLCHSFDDAPLEVKEIDIVLRIKEYAEAHFAEADFNLQHVADCFSYDARYISSKFKAVVRINFSQYLQMLRMNHAKKLISQGVTQVSELAVQCGFSDTHYFSRVFKSETGLSPRAYILQHQ